MNRFHKFLLSTGAGYLAVLANFAFTAISVPLALHFLPKEEFALWSLAVQVGAYLILLDLGMSSSVARFLADHKDSINDGAYGNILRTGQRVFLVQAVGLVFLAVLAGWALPSWLELPPHLVFDFQKLVVLQGLILALGLALRAKSAPLWAHQRTDITQCAVSASLLTSLAVMAACFYAGWGLDSFWIGSGVGSLWNVLAPWIACHRLRLYPAAQHRGSFQKDLFFRMFGFGRDVFLIQLGGLLCGGSQIFLVTKLLGLEAAAVFSVATKTLSLGQLLIGKILDGAAPGLTELFVRGERNRFALRFYQLVALSTALAAFIGIGLMGMNRAFVFFWTHGKIEWSSFGDVLLGAILISTAASRCFQGAFGMTGELHRVRFLPLAEGTVLIVGSFALGGKGGIEGILSVILLANLFVSLLGGGRQASRAIPDRFLGERMPVLLLLPYCLAAFLFWLASESLVSPLAQLITTAGILLICGVFLYKILRPFFQQRA